MFQMEFQKADSFKLEKKVKQLYKRAFPVYERKPFKMIKKTQKRGEGRDFCHYGTGKVCRFGTEMELLSHGEERLTFEAYHGIFVQVYGEKIASKVKKIS